MLSLNFFVIMCPEGRFLRPYNHVSAAGIISGL